MPKLEEDFIEHYGVLGMKWGVRKDRGSSSRSGNAKPAGSRSSRQKRYDDLRSSKKPATFKVRDGSDVTVTERPKNKLTAFLQSITRSTTIGGKNSKNLDFTTNGEDIGSANVTFIGQGKAQLFWAGLRPGASRNYTTIHDGAASYAKANGAQKLQLRVPSGSFLDQLSFVADGYQYTGQEPAPYSSTGKVWVMEKDLTRDLYKIKHSDSGVMSFEEALSLLFPKAPADVFDDDGDILVQRMSTEKDSLQHYGVLGMKWGVRKNRESTPQETRAVKTSSGKDMTLVKQNTSGLSKLLTKISPAIKSNVENSSFFDIADDTGKKVGSLQIFKESKDVLNVVWVDTKSSQKGKGYATAAMKETIKIAKEQGLKKVTLEVPGDSPDALHIYKKLGFKETGILSDEDDVWGGLTNMELDLKHSYTEDSLQHYGVLGMKWGIRKDRGSSGGVKEPRTNTPADVETTSRNGRTVNMREVKKNWSQKGVSKVSIEVDGKKVGIAGLEKNADLDMVKLRYMKINTRGVDGYAGPFGDSLDGFEEYARANGVKKFALDIPVMSPLYDAALVEYEAAGYKVNRNIMEFGPDGSSSILTELAIDVTKKPSKKG